LSKLPKKKKNNMIDAKLLEILACPACQGDVVLGGSQESPKIVCTKCGKQYPIKNGIPVLLVDEAQ
jgi:uncharacterized protein YbaR (Trm112 family)